VVASKLDGIPEAIVPGQNGTLLDPLDTDAYVETILELLADDEERSRLGQRARAFARDRYSWDIIARRYLQVFLKIIQSRGEQAGEDRRPASDDPRIPTDE
jgi:glycosyltransferase involved in cell wall biosynthesis